MAESTFPEVPEKAEFPLFEEQVLAFWKEIDAFKESQRLAEEANRPPFTFYDGPPFATGLPHYGHILAGTIKDVITRYAHQTGHQVERRFGWDCHGLPVEYEIDKRLKIKSTADVEKIGIKAYNAECRSIVTRYCKEWESVVTRFGRWIDFRNDYKTMEPWYMESVWWVFKQIFDKGLVYRGFRVMPYSTAISTTLSNFEAGQNYKEVDDPAVVVTFPLVDRPEAAFLAWTTTPWTLPSNLALCTHPTMQYVTVKDTKSGKVYILAESRLVELYPKLKKKGYKGGEFEVLEKHSGEELKGMRYTPIFPYFEAHPNAFQVICDTYVTDDSGTGIVHCAPAFGEDDFRVCTSFGIIEKGGALPCPVDADGRFTEEVTDFAGQHVKDADPGICALLKERGRLLRKSIYRHNYPFCYRSQKPLIYKAVPGWFIRVEQVKERLLANNMQTYWVPSFVQEKRFHNWLENARDWNISRSRYWGTPLPLWVSEDLEEIVCVGSIAELEELSGVKATDLHRENIDDIEIPSKKGKGMLRRISDVFDCWFESGSMPYAQQHYPFERKEIFENKFPADFIAEGLDQTRGWFYTLMVISTILFDKPPFKNLIVNGLVLAEDGKKMSKSLKNYPDPIAVVNQYGADAVRLYLINSPAVRAEEVKFREMGVLGVVREVFLPWFNAFRFFVQNSERLDASGEAEGTFDRSQAEQVAEASKNIMDRWIMAALHGLIEVFQREMAAYRLYTVVPRLVEFIEMLTNWYVRLNRERLRNQAGDATDCRQSLCTLFTVLVTLCKLMAPFTPFFTEYMYQMLMVPDNTVKRSLAEGAGGFASKSVHFELIPEPNKSLLDEQIERTMKHMQDAINLQRLLRGNDLPLKRPVKEMILVHPDEATLTSLKTVEPYIIAESNVHKVSMTTDERKWCKLNAKADGRVLGKKLGKKFKAVFAAVKELTHEQLTEFQRTGQMEIEGEVLTTEDIKLERTVIADESRYRAKVSEENLCVIIDITEDPKLMREWLAREVLNRVQKLRKSSNVLVSDVLRVFLEVLDEPKKAHLLEALKENEESMIVPKLKAPLMPHALMQENAVIAGQGEDEVDGIKIRLTLVRPCLYVNPKAPVAVKSLLMSMDYGWVCNNGMEKVAINIDGKEHVLKRGEDYFLDAPEALKAM